MKNLSIGKFRGLQQCASPGGTFTCLALDHRQALRKTNPAFADDRELSRFKLEVAAELAPYATAVLLDPQVSAAQAIAAGSLPGDKGLVVAVEASGYGGEATGRKSNLLPGWSVEKAKRMGASMVKLLVYYHPAARTAADIEALAAQVGADCRKHDLALMLEPLSYSLAEAKLSSNEKRYVVTETARRLTPIAGVDLLKAELPLDAADDDPNRLAEACGELSAASATPWILLSAAASFDVYQRQVEAACQAGASGVAVGRAVWQESVRLSGPERAGFLRTTARERISRLNDLCAALGRPFTDFWAAEAPFDWYQSY